MILEFDPRREFSQLPHQPIQYTHAVIEQPGVVGPGDVGFRNGGVKPDGLSVFDFFLMPSFSSASLIRRIVSGEIILIDSLRRVKCGIFFS